MAGISLGAWGMILMVFQGLCVTANLMLGRLLKDLQLPFFRISAVSAGLMCCMIVVGLTVVGVELPAKTTRKWVFARGVFGVANFVFLVLAVRVGTSAGDVASLASVNTIVAALAGRIFLKEQLRGWHFFAIGCCLLGGLLISKPKFLFGASAGESSWLGCGLAVAGGFAAAGIAISSRKSGTVSVWWLTLCTLFLSGNAFVILPWMGAVEDFSLEPFKHSTWNVMLWVMLLLGIMLLAILSSSAGNQWCPAAVSATIGTAARMVWGYLAELLVFGNTPEPLTLTGATLMLLSVLVMTLARKPAPQGQAASSPSAASQDCAPTGLPDTQDDDDESLGSFMASEFAVKEAHEARLRRPAREELPPGVFGVVTSVASL